MVDRNQYKCKTCHQELVTEGDNYYPKSPYYQVICWLDINIIDGKPVEEYYCENDWEKVKSNYLNNGDFSIFKNDKQQINGQWTYKTERIQEGKPILDNHWRCLKCGKVEEVSEDMKIKEEGCSSCHSKELEIKVINLLGLHFTNHECSKCHKIKDCDIHYLSDTIHGNMTKEEFKEKSRKESSNEMCVCNNRERERERERAIQKHHQRPVISLTF